MALEQKIPGLLRKAIIVGSASIVLSGAVIGLDYLRNYGKLSGLSITLKMMTMNRDSPFFDQKKYNALQEYTMKYYSDWSETDTPFIITWRDYHNEYGDPNRD